MTFIYFLFVQKKTYLQNSNHYPTTYVQKSTFEILHQYCKHHRTLKQLIANNGFACVVVLRLHIDIHYNRINFHTSIIYRVRKKFANG